MLPTFIAAFLWSAGFAVCMYSTNQKVAFKDTSQMLLSFISHYVADNCCQSILLKSNSSRILNAKICIIAT